MAQGFCNVCHQAITDGYQIVRGKKICQSCLNHQKESDSEKKERLMKNDKDKEGFFAFLLSLFPIGVIPESWYSMVDTMLKKRFTCDGIQRTLQYCINTGKYFTEDNWSSLVYIYYAEAQQVEKKKQQIQKINEQKKIVVEVETVKIKNTNHRDLPNFKIEDL